MKILVFGPEGQLGREVVRRLAGSHELISLARRDLDLADVASIGEAIAFHRPAVIVNAAAYTAVDEAESKPDLAFAVNAAAPEAMASAARGIDARLVHVSTDYVFDGAKGSPYVEDDATNPLSVYGRSKRDGEERVAARGARSFVLRTGWVFSSHGRNFLLTMLRLAREGRTLRVVDDQRGAPTYAADLAAAIVQLIDRGDDQPPGTYHVSAAGETTWCRFAQAIVRRAGLATTVVPITTAEYPTPARRPAYSVLSNAKLRRTFGIELAPWEDGLARCMATLP